MIYAKSTGGFYDRAIHGDAIPADAVNITAAHHAELLSAQSAGKRIEADANGYPVAVDPPPPTLAEAQLHAAAAIDAAAGAARARYITVKAQKLIELLKAREAAEQENVTVQGKVFSAEPKIADKFEKLASRLRRGKASKLTTILTVDGTPVQVTQQLLEQIEDAIADQMEIVWNKYGTLVAQVNAATTVAQVNAVVW